jgi:hypothetical protein
MNSTADTPAAIADASHAAEAAEMRMALEDALKILFGGEKASAYLAALPQPSPPPPKDDLRRFWDSVGDLTTGLEMASLGAREAARVAAKYAAGGVEMKARETGEHLLGMLNIVYVAEREAHQIRVAVTDTVRSLGIADHLPQPGTLTRQHGEGVMRAAWAKLGYSPEAHPVAKAEKTTEAVADEAAEKKE